ncbi:MAG TPA: porin family protein [Ignavibacteriaceae bacterium]|nr:porin family protein [Ignavibacteriaceae bacterium]
MKRIIFLSILFISAISFMQVNAQIKLGVQGGVNLAGISMDPEESGFDTGTRTALVLGGIINFDLSPLLSLQAEPSYVQKGSSVDITQIQNGINIKGEGNISINYIEIPILLKVTFPTPQIKPFLVGGASVSFRAGDAKLTLDKVTGNGQDVTNLIPAEDKEQTMKSKSTDFVLNFGAGLMIPVSLLDIFIEGQYNLGLTNINDESNDDTKIKNHGIQIKAGLLFSLEP